MEIFRKQIEAILKETEKEASSKNNDYQKIAAVQMYKMLITCIVKYVEQQVAKTPEFEKLLNLEWKSAERMLRHVVNKAKSLAVSIPGANGAACCILDEMVYDWVYEYYQLDDKAEVEEERRKAAEAKAKKEAEDKKRAENKVKAREKAIEKLSATEGWAEKSDEDREKEIAKEAASIEYKLNREIGKEKKPAAKKAATKSTAKKAKKEEKTEAKRESSTPEKSNTPALSEPAEEPGKEPETETTAPAKEAEKAKEIPPAPAGTIETPDLSTEEDGQFSLFDLAG